MNRTHGFFERESEVDLLYRLLSQLNKTKEQINKLQAVKPGPSGQKALDAISPVIQLVQNVASATKQVNDNDRPEPETPAPRFS